MRSTTNPILATQSRYYTSPILPTSTSSVLCNYYLPLGAQPGLRTPLPTKKNLDYSVIEED